MLSQKVFNRVRSHTLSGIHYAKSVTWKVFGGRQLLENIDTKESGSLSDYGVTD